MSGASAQVLQTDFPELVMAYRGRCLPQELQVALSSLLRQVGQMRCSVTPTMRDSLDEGCWHRSHGSAFRKWGAQLAQATWLPTLIPARGTGFPQRRQLRSWHAQLLQIGAVSAAMTLTISWQREHGAFTNRRP